MTVAMITGVFTGANQTGAAQLFGVSQTERLSRFASIDLVPYGMYRNIRSVRAYASTTSDSTTILFRFPVTSQLFGKDYDGAFLQITHGRSSGSEFDVDNLADYDFDRNATSMLLVRTKPDREWLRLSFRDIFLNGWKSTLDPLLNPSGVTRIGDPILTWDLYPAGVNGLDANKRFLKVHQYLYIPIPFWSDMVASITYTIHLGVNTAGNATGKVAGHASWLQSGIKYGSVMQQLEAALVKGEAELNKQFRDTLQFLGNGLTDLYFLPGRQLTAAPTGVMTGLTTDDVTIVIVA